MANIGILKYITAKVRRCFLEQKLIIIFLLIMCSLMVCHNTLSFTAIFTFVTFIWFSPRETHTCVIVNNQTLQMPDHILDIWTSFLTMFYFEMIFKTGFIRKISTTFITWNFWTVCWVYMINQNMWL